MLRFGRRQQPAVGSDDVDLQQVVDRHPVLTHQPSHPTGECQPGDADGGHVAAWRRQSVDVRSSVVRSVPSLSGLARLQRVTRLGVLPAARLRAASGQWLLARGSVLGDGPTARSPWSSKPPTDTNWPR